MEEDIKYLDKMVKEYKQFGDLHNPEYEDTDRIYQALENLIKGYRELEESNKILNDLYWNACIPKSKIKEKIEELEKQIDDLMQNGDVHNDNVAKYNDLKLKIEVLQELM